MIMRLRTILFAFVLSLAALSAAHAAPVSLERARALALGSMRGSAVQAPGTDGRDGGGQALVLAKEAVADVAGHGRATLYYVFKTHYQNYQELLDLKLNLSLYGNKKS